MSEIAAMIAVSQIEKRPLDPAMVREAIVSDPGMIIAALEAHQAAMNLERQEGRQAILASSQDRIFSTDLPHIGDDPGDVMVAMFNDYQCGFCRSAHEMLKIVIEETPGLRLVIHEFPILGPASREAACLVHAIRRIGGQSAYEMAHDALFENRDLLLDPEYGFPKLVADLGLSMEDVSRVMRSEEVEADLLQASELAAILGIRGTPNFIIGTEILEGLPSLESFQAILEKARSDR